MLLQVFLPIVCFPNDEAQAGVEMIDDLELFGIEEIVETRQICQLRTHQLMQVAFVFTETEIKDCGIDWLGMNNVFLCRYKYDNQEQHGGGFLPRSSPFAFYCGTNVYDNKVDFFRAGLCFHSCIWEGLCIIQDTVHKCMNVSSQGQRHKQTKKANISSEVWRYVKSVFKDTTPVVSFTTKSIRQIIYMGAKRKATSVASTTEMIRFETMNHLVAFSKVFGSACVFGIRQRKPKLGTVAHLKASEIFNIVAAKEVANAPPQRATADDSIDLKFDGRVLTVVTRYTKYVYNRDTNTGNAENCPSLIVADIINRSEHSDETSNGDGNSVRSIHVGDSFEDQERGLVLRVAEKNADFVRCCIIYPPGRRNEYITYNNLTLVRDMINAYM